MQLVADANVLLSAVIGGRAALVLRHEQVEQVFTPTAAHDEVFEYLAPLAKKKRLQLDTLLLTLAALPVTVVERSDYEHHLPEAKRRIASRRINGVSYNEDWPILLGLIFLCAFSLGHRRRRRALQRDILPRKRRLETLLKELDRL